VNSGAEEPLVVWKEHVVVDEWTPDGKCILFRNLGRAIWAVPADGERKPRPTRRDQGPSGNEEREATLYFNLNSFNCLSLTGDGAPAIRSTA